MPQTSDNTLVQKLKQPYVFDSSPAKRLTLSFSVGVFVFLFLFVFKPFGLNLVAAHIGWITAGYGLITFVVMALVNVGLLFVFPSYYNEANWTVSREILLNLLNVSLIGLANTLYSAALGFIEFTLPNILLFELFTFTIGFFPVSILVMMREARLKKEFESGSALLTGQIEQHREHTVDHPTANIVISSENGREQLLLDEEQLLFIRAAENYVEVHYLLKQQLQRKLIRTTMKSVCDTVAHLPGLFRCHKSYLVNLSKVKRVSGNAQGFKLHLAQSEEPVPVSRNLNQEIKKRFPV